MSKTWDKETLFSYLDRRTNWETNAVKSMLGNTQTDVYTNAIAIGDLCEPPAPIVDKSEYKATVLKNPRYYPVQSIKRFDIVHVDTFASVHFVVVVKVFGDTVYGIVISSKEKVHSMKMIEGDRRFIGNYLTSTVIAIPLDEAKSNFIGSYESKKEIREFMKNLKDLTDKILNG